VQVSSLKGEFVEYMDDGGKYPKKNSEKELEISFTPEFFKNAGRLLTDDELAIDIDELPKEVIEKIIDLFNIKTEIVWTTRGAHFYFKKPQGFRGSKKICPLGFEVEYKHKGNSPNGLTIKQNGEMRIIKNEGVREDLPEIFYTNRKLESLWGKENGDGRNTALFQHRMKIFDLKEWKKILRFINNHIFTDPLTEEELQTVAREGVKPKAEKDNEPHIAEHLLKKYKMVSYLDNLYFFDDNRFTSDENELIRMVYREIGLQKTRYVDEIVKQLKYQAPIVKQSENPFLVKLSNGFLKDGKFFEMDYDDFTPHAIKFSYIENAPPVQTVDDYINFLTDNNPDYRNRLLEMMAHPLITDKNFKRMLRKFFIMMGSGENGKGELLSILRQILGSKNCSALSIKQIADPTYFPALKSKLVNLGDDIEDAYITPEQMKHLKNISSCDYIASRELYELSTDTTITTSLIFSSNHMLKTKEKGHSYKSRVTWLPMYKKPTKKDRRFAEKLTTPEAKEYWLRLMVEAYMRLYENEGFTYCETIENFNEEYHRANNHLLEFFEEYDKEWWVKKQKRECYLQYKDWCRDIEEEFPFKANKFHEELCNYYKLELKRFDVRYPKKTTVYKYVPIEGEQEEEKPQDFSDSSHVRKQLP
jgi:putative DNA primase/helicase